MLPENVAVKIDEPESRFHGKTGFVLNNKNSGIIKPCNQHTLEECQDANCSNGETLPDGWYEIVFDPMISGGFANCTEWFDGDNLVVNGC